ncbi:MAG: copper-binding protein [Sulfuritalea sp.]|nr:copper-binding protein [Sulfuritalea sp.]
MKHFALRAAVALALASFLQPVIAMDHSAHAAPAAKSKTASQPLSEGNIRRLDRAAGSITITHGPIENLGMGAMTMTFTFKKGVVPASVKEGDKVRFRAEEKSGQYTVVRVVAAK